jgi:serine/threonine-protein kinase
MQAVIAKRFVHTPADVTTLREGVPKPVGRVVQTALARAPIERYDTAAAFGSALSDAQTGNAVPRTSAPEKSIAVLPFGNLSADPENEFFADGITEEILNALASIPDLRVAGRASSFSFKGKNADLRSIGEQLNVHTVLEGSVRRAGRRVRITAQLSDVSDGFRLWSERYDREIEDVFAVQDEIAAAIAVRLKTTFQESAGRGQRSTGSIEAYEAYLKGRALIFRRGWSVREGVALMRRALELDPEYALAWAGVADAYSVFAYYGVLPPETCATAAHEAAAKALAYGPDLAESHNAMAQVSLLFDWNWTRTEQSFTRALELSPTYVQAVSWHALFYLGFVRRRWDETIERLLALQRAEPLSAYAAGCCAVGLSDCRRGAEALHWSALACRIDPSSYLSLWSQQLAFYSSGDYPRSIEAADRALAVSGRMQSSLVTLGVALAGEGEQAGAQAIRHELDARAVREPISPLYRAILAAALHDKDAAMVFAHEALARRDPLLVVFGQSVVAGALQAIPEYQTVLEAAGLV